MCGPDGMRTFWRVQGSPNSLHNKQTNTLIWIHYLKSSKSPSMIVCHTTCTCGRRKSTLHLLKLLTDHSFICWMISSPFFGYLKVNFIHPTVLKDKNWIFSAFEASPILGSSVEENTGKNLTIKIIEIHLCHTTPAVTPQFMILWNSGPVNKIWTLVK